MAKRLSSGQSNTLFNYFQSPSNKPKLQSVNGSTPGDSSTHKKKNTDDSPKVDSKKRRRAVVDSDSDSENSPKNSDASKKKKETVSLPDAADIKVKKSLKRKFAICDSDSDDAADPSFKPAASAQSESEESEGGSEEVETEEDVKVKVKAKSKKSLKAFEFDKSLNETTSKESQKERVKTEKPPSVSLSQEENWPHNKLDFLQPGKIRDNNRNRPGHPDYDEKTVHVPEEFLNKLTPAMRQWWILKGKHYDTVLFFKMGKFYELIHMDAVIAVNHLGLCYMKGDYAHSGFPEVAYGKMASSLVEQGFKVARVEQTETPEIMTERCKQMRNSTKFDRVIKREICQVTTKATCVYGAQLSDAKQPFSCYLLALAEKPTNIGSRFGVCFVDTSIGVFHIGEFDDDVHYSRLLVLLAAHNVGLILTERGCLQSSTNELLKKTLTEVRRDVLSSNSQFYSAQHTVDVLLKGCYFKEKNDEFHWPPVLKDLIADGAAKPHYELAVRALGACVWYLKDSEIDIHVLSMRKFQMYHPVDTALTKTAVERDHMVLDSTTMENLSLLGSLGTLQKTLDLCETPFGKRLLRQWICRPLCMQERIAERQMAVRELYQNDEVRRAVRAAFKKLPDLERQVAKIHHFGNKFCTTNHPDGRAVLYETSIYSKRKILDLTSTLNGFEKVQEIANIFGGCESNLLVKLTQHPPQGKFEDLRETLKFFRNAFDQQKAEKEGKIIPQSGIDEDYDQAVQELQDVQNEAQDYLKELQDYFGCKISYIGTDKKRFQIEVPDSKSYKVPSEYTLEGKKKSAKRYTTATSRKLLADTIKAETKKNKIIQDLNRRIFEKFSDRQAEWEGTIQCLMMLDVLCSFAEYAQSSPNVICFPEVLPFQKEPFIKIESGIHPCTFLENFIPNSTALGTDEAAKIMLLTGPNMGGKSTLMRQVALITIMAQMGCPVPAASCQMTLVDRIFTRLGARDDILKGQSTFLVELSEAAAILQHATSNSLVLLDELGRGTSTHDGNAIATAYIHKLTEMQCRTMFSTHYHSLVDRYTNRTDIQLAHMACMTEDDNEDDDSLKPITFLYTVQEGNCPKSYGFNAARLAGLPKSVINRAHAVACKFEEATKLRRLLCNLMVSDIADCRQLITSMKSNSVLVSVL